MLINLGKREGLIVVFKLSLLEVFEELTLALTSFQTSQDLRPRAREPTSQEVPRSAAPIDSIIVQLLHNMGTCLMFSDGIFELSPASI